MRGQGRERGAITLWVTLATFGMMGGTALWVHHSATLTGNQLTDNANGVGLIALGSTFAGAATAGLWMVYRILSKQIDRQSQEIRELSTQVAKCEAQREIDHVNFESARKADRWRIAMLIRGLQEAKVEVPDAVFRDLDEQRPPSRDDL